MIDTHLHLFDPASHPFAATAPYRPRADEFGTWAELQALLDAHGVERGLLVAPTAGYDRDTAALPVLLAPARPRLAGVARLRGDEPAALLDTLAAQGVLGVRLDVQNDGPACVAQAESGGAVAAWARRGWFVQVQARAADWPAVAERVGGWPLALVIDHCGLPDLRLGLQQPGFQAVLALARGGRAWAKLSGPFRFSAQPWPHADTDAYAAALLQAFGPGRCLWGSDWPFVRLPQRPTYVDSLKHLDRWVPDARQRAVVLGASPRALLGAAG